MTGNEAVLGVLAVALFLALLNKTLLDALVAPVRRRWPDLDLWWVDYVAFATGLCITWVAEINLLATFMAQTPAASAVGRVITGFLVGGGTALLNQVFVGMQGRGDYTQELVLPTRAIGGPVPTLSHKRRVGGW